MKEGLASCDVGGNQMGERGEEKEKKKRNQIILIENYLTPITCSVIYFKHAMFKMSQLNVR